MSRRPTNRWPRETVSSISPMPSIRIAQVVEAAEGGCKRHVLGLLAGLDRDRFRQTAVVSPWREEGVGEEMAAAAAGSGEVIVWDVGREARPRADYGAYCFLRELFRRHTFDVIHCHSAKAGFLGRLAARGLPASVVYTPHCLPFMMHVFALWQVAYLWMERFAGRFTHRLIAVSPSEAEIAVRTHLVPPDRVVTIENGIDPGAFGPPVGIEQKRDELHLSPECRVALGVGALRQQKGWHHLVEAAPEVLKAHPDTVFLIAGEGRLRRVLEARVRELALTEHVRLLGRRTDVPELLAVADCFVIPSLWEGGPYALLEAMAAGVPVVGTSIPGILDWVRDGETGYGVRAADSGQLAMAIEAVMSDPAEAGRRAAVARQMVLWRNTEERWLRDMAALYESAAAEGRHRSVPTQ